MRILIASWITVVTVAAIAAGTTVWAAPGDPRFTNYMSPVGVADDAGEPTLGSNWTTEESFPNSNGPIPNGGTVNYFGGFLPYMLNIKFNDCQSPAKVIWNQRTLLTANTPRVYGDPILYVDKDTGRTLVAQLEGLTPLGSTTDFTDNDGIDFLPTEGSGLPSCVDHQTLGGGPFHAPLPPGTVYPNAVYYCSQCVADATCSLSLDGGITFGPGVPIFTVLDCTGLHGHIKVGSDGTAYVPPRGCGGRASVVVSADNGATWDVRPISTGNSTTSGNDDPSVGVCINDPSTIYLGWSGTDFHPRIARSTNQGLTWGPITDVGASLGIKGIAFPAVVAGDRDRAAFAFFGTLTQGAYTSPGFPGVWHLYIATTYDGGATWLTQNVTPNDPIQRGGICNSGTCRNLLDFFDATIDKQGRVLVAGEDGCIGACVSAPPNCSPPSCNSFTAKAFITRQSGGKRMFAANDPVEPRIAEAPGVGGTLVGSTANLSWQAPDNGGAAITAYKVYRRIGTVGSFELRATVSGTEYSESVNPLDDIYYRLTAVNSQGEGPYCGAFRLVGGIDSPCALPGVLATNDVTVDGEDLDSGQNTPPDQSVNIKELRVSEPYAGLDVDQLTFRLQVGQNGTLTPSSQWYIIWARQTIAADGSDRRFVAMKTDAAGALSFVYGDFGPPLPLGSAPPPNANTPLPLGPADFGSYNVASGEIIIKLATSKADATPLDPGEELPALNVRTYIARPDGGQRSQNNANDITGDGSYTLVGNESCFCTVDQPPVAAMQASPTSGTAPLVVNFDGSASSDPDPGDAVASYTFNFGDGTLPVTQSSSTISHTYTVASGTSGFFATLTVRDQQCDVQSLNVASVNIHVSSSTGIGAAEAPPIAFGLEPLHNPAQGQVFLDMALPQDGTVKVQAFSANGRSVGTLMNSWMAAGKYRLHWAALERGKHLPAGVYMVRATSGGRSVVSRVVLVH